MSEPRITDVRATPHAALFEDIFGSGRVPEGLTAPASHFRRIPRLGQFMTLVEIVDDEGRRGYGECFGLPDPAPAASLVNRVARPALLGRPLGEPPADLLADLATYFAALGNTRGPAMEALSGLDIALWDLAAKRAGTDLAAALGGTRRPLPTYVSPIALMEEPAHSAEAARRFAESGERAMKLKIGRGVATDVAHVAAVRDAIGERALMLDANTAYGREEAAALATALEPYDIGWIEEPLATEDVEGLAWLAARTSIALASGENAFSAREFAVLLEVGEVAVIQPNITRAGGVSGFRAIDAMCAEHGARLAPHGVFGSVGLAATLHACCALPSLALLESNRLVNPMRDAAGPEFEGRDGTLLAPAGPGHGGDPDMTRLAPYRVGDGLAAIA